MQWVKAFEGGAFTLDFTGELGAINLTLQYPSPLSSPTAFTELEVGKAYTVTLNGTNMDNAVIYFDLPPGFSFFIDGRNTVTHVFTVGQGQATGDRTVTIAAGGVVPILAAGDDLNLRANNITWAVGLGLLSNGSSAGMLTVREADLNPTCYTPDVLKYIPPAGDEAKVVQTGTALRQVKTDSVLADVLPITDGFEIRFYKKGDFGDTLDANNLYPLLNNPTPFVKYALFDPAPPNKLQLQIDRMVWNGAAYDVVKSFVCDTATANLTTVSAGRGAEILRFVKDDNSGPDPNVHTITVKKDGGTADANAAAVTQKTYAVYAADGLSTNGYTDITRIVEDSGGNNYTTDYAYFTAPSDISSYRKLKSVENPDGSWMQYEFYDASDFDKQGLVHRTYEPFLDTPAALFTGKVTTFDYATADPRTRDLPSSIVVTMESAAQKVSEMAFSYSFGTANGKEILIATVDDHYGAGATDFLTTTTKKYSRDLPDADWRFRDRAWSVAQPDGTKQSFLYQTGTYAAGAFTADTTTADGPAWRRILFNGTAVDPGGTSGAVLFTTYGSALNNALDAIYLIPFKSTIAISIRDNGGNIVKTETMVFTGGTAFASIDSSTAQFDAGNRPVNTSDENGLEVSSAVFNADGRMASKIGTGGLKTTFDYDALGRVVQETVFKADDVTPLSSTVRYYDATGKVTASATVPGQLSLPLPADVDQIPNAVNVTKTEYDKGGRVVKETLACGKVVATVYGTVGTDFRLTTTQTLKPDNSVYSDLIRQNHKDGRTDSVTGSPGLGASVDEFYTYTVETTGNLRVRRTQNTPASPRWTETLTDWLNRTLEEKSPGSGSNPDLTTTSVYYSDAANDGPNLGKLKSVSAPGLGTTFNEYGPLGELSKTGTDVDGGTGLQDASNDRIQIFETTYFNDGDDWWLQSDAIVLPKDGAADRFIQSRTRSRLTFAAAGTDPKLISETRSWGMNPDPLPAGAPVTLTTTTLDRAINTLVETVNAPGTSNDQVSTTVDGRVISIASPTGEITRNTYDAEGRLDTQSRVRDAADASKNIETKFIYVPGRDTIQEIQARDETGTFITQVENNYDSCDCGQLTWEKNAEGQFTRYAYNARGQVTHLWGDAVHPVKFIYNAYGERIEMHTYRDGTTADWNTASLPAGFAVDGDKTVWNFDEATGLLLSKQDPAHTVADPREVLFAYNAINQLATRTWARGVATTYGYSATTGEQTSVAYSDGTPNLLFTYNRLGQTATVTEGGDSRTFHYRDTDDFQLDYEDLPDGLYGAGQSIGRIYDAGGSNTGFWFGQSATINDYSVDYQFNAANGLLQSVTANGQQFDYAYLPNSGQVDTVTSGNYAVDRDYSPYRNSLLQIATKYGPPLGETLITEFHYQRDKLGRTLHLNESGEIFNRYGAAGAGLMIKNQYSYASGESSRGALASSITYLADPADKYDPALAAEALPGRKFGYDFDAIGNRKSATENDRQGTYAADPNGLNSYLSRQVPRFIDVYGAAAAGTKVTVKHSANQYAPTSRKGEYFYGELDYSGQSGAISDAITIYAVLPGTPLEEIVTSAPYTETLPPETQTFTYDKDGNLLDDGVRTFEWDGENRLARTADASEELLFQYDYQGRRTEKKFSTWNGTAWVEVYTRRFVYDGFNLIAELDATGGATPSLERAYTWGTDLSGNFQGAGGIGGLLMITDGANDYVPAQDGGGNIFALLDLASGSVVAAREYAPFGEVIRRSGAYQDNPFGFATKYTDGETGLVYFGLRYYSPSLGRFLNRDPSGESGG